MESVDDLLAGGLRSHRREGGGVRECALARVTRRDLAALEGALHIETTDSLPVEVPDLAHRSSLALIGALSLSRLAARDSAC